MNIESLTTEASDPRYADIDTRDVAELAALMNEADHSVPLAVRDALDQIVPAIEAVVERMRSGGRLFYIGAGTPGRIAVLDASEIPPTFSTSDRVIAIMAGGSRAIVEAVEGAEDDADAGAAAIDAAAIGSHDAVIGIAASGRTPFVIGAISRAKQLGALTIGLSCNSDTELSRVADHGIEVLTGPEFISGSTRLKAGTAQKLVLNMFSTITMVRLGKTYGNLMVDVNASNEKLRIRAARIVSRLTGVSEDSAHSLLAEADYSVPLAVVAQRKQLPISEARMVLAAANGHLKHALGNDGELPR